MVLKTGCMNSTPGCAASTVGSWKYLPVSSVFVFHKTCQIDVSSTNQWGHLGCTLCCHYFLTFTSKNLSFKGSTEQSQKWIKCRHEFGSTLVVYFRHKIHSFCRCQSVGKKKINLKKQIPEWNKIISPPREGWKKAPGNWGNGEKRKSFTSECASEVSMLYTDIEKT